MQLISPAFENEQSIPRRYTGEGENLSPPLEWFFLPEKCKSLSLICEDKDATSGKGRDSPFVHWVLYNIPPGAAGLPEGIAATDSPDLPYEIAQGKNSFQGIGYSGPIPPVGEAPHRYVFSLYALRKDLELDLGLSKSDLINEMRGEILAIARLTGVYQREARKAG